MVDTMGDLLREALEVAISSDNPELCISANKLLEAFEKYVQAKLSFVKLYVGSSEIEPGHNQD